MLLTAWSDFKHKKYDEFDDTHVCVVLLAPWSDFNDNGIYDRFDDTYVLVLL